MANRLKMAVQHTIITLARQGWSQRRIAAQLGVDRDTVARYVKAAEAEARAAPSGSPPEAAPGSNAAISIIGSDWVRFDAHLVRIFDRQMVQICVHGNVKRVRERKTGQVGVRLIY